MSKVTMFCLGVLMSSMLGKTEAVDLGEACTQNSDCTSPAVCQPSTKTCLIGVGGTCTGNTDCVIGAACTSTTCACGTGYTENDKLCAADNTYGGTCTLSGTVDSCVTTGADANAVCTNSKCACKSAYTGAIGVKCYVLPNTYGGSCSLTGSTDSCVTPGGDPNAKCNASTNGICGCNTHYTGSIGSKCEVIPNKYGGSCTISGSTDSCVTPGGDPNAKCGASTNGICGCKDSYTGSIGSICIADNTYGGKCTISGTVDSCVTPGGDVNAVCTNSKCACKSGYTGAIGVKCSGTMALTSSVFILIAALLVKTHLE